MRCSERDRALNDREAKQIGIKRCLLGAVDRFTQRIAVHQPDHREQHQRGTRRTSVGAHSINAPSAITDKRDQNFRRRHRRAVQMQCDAGHHRQHEGN